MPGMKPEHRAVPMGHGKTGPVPVHDPDLSIADSKMPMLVQALNPAYMARALREQVESSGRSPFSGTAWLVAAIYVRRHKPGRRCLIEYELADPEKGGRFSVLGKIRAKGLDRRSHAVQQHLWENGFDGSCADGVSVPEPLGLLPHLSMWLQKKVSARPVIQGLNGENGPALAGRIAEALHKLHRLGPLPERVHGMEDELRILETQLTALTCLHPAWKNRIDELLGACTRLGRSLPYSPPCPSQRDCYHDNILFDGDRLFLVDLDLYCQGDPGLDPGNFIAHLIDYSLRSQRDPGSLSGIEQALATRFGALTGHIHDQRVAVYTTLSLARLIAVSTRIPGREQWTGRLMDLCELRIEELHS
ncbi:MAG: phosphotransferase [Pseudomonadota bacterium]|nr:phosphotransferase [Pseudomonadota bacterium]